MIKAILFDMDGTLYFSPVIRNKFAEAAIQTLADFKEWSLETAQQEIEATRERLKVQYGSSVPYTLTLRTFGIPIEVWHEQNIAYFDPRDFLDPDPSLRASLKMLKGKYILAVLTNNNCTQAERTLEALDVKDMFNAVFTYNSFKLLKPDPEFYEQAVSQLNVAITECCVVGDRYDVDLKPAKDLGMCVLEVKGPEDIHLLQRRLNEGE